MVQWAKVKFFYKTMLSKDGASLTATTTDTSGDYHVSYIHNMLEVNGWKAADATDPHFIYHDGNLLLNSNFESWTGGFPDNWLGTGPVVQDTLNVKSVASSAKLTRTGGVDASIYQSIPNYRDYIGRTFTAGVWCYAASPNQARLAIWDGSGITAYAYHSGTPGWEFIETSKLINEGATDIRIYLQVVGTDGDANFDLVSAGFPASADYIAVLGHNLNTVEGTLTLECSPDHFETRYHVLAARPLSDKVILEEAPLVIGDFEVWPYGNTVAPAGWTKNGTATIDKETNASYIHSGRYSVKLTNQAGYEAYIESAHHNNSVFQNISYWRGKTLSFGSWVKANDANRVRVEIYDDAGSSASAYHTGSGGWEFLSVTRTVDANTNTLRLRLSIETGATSITAWFDDAKAVIGTSIGPDDSSDLIPQGLNAMRHWRLLLSGHNAPPEMSICIWGDKVELDYATASFDPHGEEVKAEVGVSYGGYVAGIHTRYAERQMTLRFNDADSGLYGKVRNWWEDHGVKNLFVAWERKNNPTDVFLMRPDTSFKNPLTGGGAYRDITINLKGRKE